MINLLPYDTKKQIRAARTNSILIKYLFISLAAAAFVLLSCLMVYILLLNSPPKTNTNSTITTTSNSVQSSDEEYATQKSRLDSIYASFSATKPILQQQISFSDIITSIGENLPANVIIENLSLNSSNIGSPTTLAAKAKSSSDIAKIKDNLQKSPIFTNVSVQSEKTNASDTSGYPVSANINITINRGVQ